jgi:hypothetical protein
MFLTMTGYIAPFMIASSILTATGLGVLSTLTPESSHASWIGFQVLTGLGFGIGMQMPLNAAQTILHISDVSTGTSIVNFARGLGGAVFISLGQAFLSNRLAVNLNQYSPSLDPKDILALGAARIQDSIHQQELEEVRKAYNGALVYCFIASAVIASMSIIGSFAIGWKSIKASRISHAAV